MRHGQITYQKADDAVNVPTALFGHDGAIGHAIKVIKEIAQGDDRLFAHMMDKVLVASPLGVVGYYAQEYSLLEKLQGEVDESMVSVALIFIFLLKLGIILTVLHQDRRILDKLDSGLGDELFEKYRAAQIDGVRDFEDDSKYLQVVFAAIMMEYGATIKEAQMKQIRELVPTMVCNESAVMPPLDYGFRGSGKRQFLAALDHYQAGKPRSFQQPSCHGCGKVDDDIKAEGKTLLKCGGCKNQITAAWFCGKVRVAISYHSTLRVVDILAFLAGLSESLVEAPQAELRCPSRARNRPLQIIRQEYGDHRLRGCQCVRVLHDGTDAFVHRVGRRGGHNVLSSHPLLALSCCEED